MAKPGDVWRSRCGAVELRCGRWQDVLGDVVCDALITDPPYSKRTHVGQRTGSSIRVATIDFADLGDGAEALASRWSGLVSWAVIFGDHQSFNEHEIAWQRAGSYVFAPIPWVKTDPPPRMSGDGPSCDAEWIMVAAKRERRTCGSISGHYIGSCGKRGGSAGTGFPTEKPLWLMRRIVTDYSNPGQAICDPCAGSGTTLLAAAIEGRRAIGAEMDPATFEIAVKRLEKGWTPVFHGFASEPMRQGSIL